MITTALAVTAVVSCVALVAGATIWLQKVWRRVCERIARPFVAQYERRFRDRETLIRDCGQECVNSVLSGQRDTIGALAREGFSAMVELNRELLCELRTRRSPLVDQQQVTMAERSPREPLYRLPHGDGPQQALVPRRPLVDLLLFWKKRGG